ncbi:MAG TPA: DegV family EDD domain-containing protein, partial [Corynebacterium sp.]|uniref:DegV family protein n=1 Tax=Corynebacterium sp. TaxID=1720 RepID=UPI0017B413E7
MVGAGMGAAAVAAAEKAAEGGDLDECVAVAEDVLDRNRLWLYVPKLELLRRGGRISTGQAVLSTALAIKPIVGIQDGTLGLVAKCRTEAKVLDKLVDFAATEAAGRPAHVMLQHSGADERVEELHAMLSLELPEGSTFDVVDLPAALVAHTGPGAYALGMVVAEEAAGAAVAAAGGAGAGAGGAGAGADADTELPPTKVVGRDASPLFTTVAAKLPTWSENRRAAIEKAEALAHAIAELARRDNSDPEGAAFGRVAREEAAQKAADRANGGDGASDAGNEDAENAEGSALEAARSESADSQTSESGADDVESAPDNGGEGEHGGVVKR